ncbi:hypothetical protein HJFPF1_08213 [Paramyrothecium foliicola]|nr:hypothetical protein HJFPF1_08213 [Paramyrothecium foliicola]
MVSCDCQDVEVSMVIGLDIGATYSGAYGVERLTCKKHGNTRICKRYEVRKFPTVLVFHRGKNTVRFPDDNLPEPVEDGCERVTGWTRRNYRRGVEIPAEQLISEFLRGLFERASAKFKLRSWARRYRTQAKLVITYPDCWSGRTLRRFQDAVRVSEVADEPTVDCILYESEAEVALRGIQQEIPDILREHRQQHDVIIVLDCGGLTVDAGAYHSANPKKPLLADCVTIGGVTLDMHFSDMLNDEVKKRLSMCERSIASDRLDADVADIMRDWHQLLKEQYWHQTPGEYVWNISNKEIVVSRDADLLPIVKEYTAQVIGLATRVFQKARESHGGMNMGGFIPSVIKHEVEMTFPEIKVYLAKEEQRWNMVAYGAAHFHASSEDLD